MILVRFTIDNRNRLIFYGNMVGYVKDDAAVVDEMFQTDELFKSPKALFFIRFPKASA